MTESSISQHIIPPDQSVRNQSSKALKRVQGYLKCYYDDIRLIQMDEWFIGNEILIFKEKLLICETSLADLCLILKGRKASTCNKNLHFNEQPYFLGKVTMRES